MTAGARRSPQHKAEGGDTAGTNVGVSVPPTPTCCSPAKHLALVRDFEAIGEFELAERARLMFGLPLETEQEVPR